jgi:serine/threonine protein kinase
MGDKSEVVGQGTYGCVHYPPLLCENSSERDLTNISKLMNTGEANKELKEYVLIDNIDRVQNFYLGQPIKCRLGLQKSNRRAIRDCDMSSDVFEDYSDYSLLIMKNGGINLSDYAKKMKPLTASSENKKKMDDFWLETHRLMMGLKLFHEKNIIHHDMKAGNIVYSEEKTRLNFIDFGLMTTNEKILQQNRSNENWLSMFHWSFPLELGYLQKKEFEDISRLSETHKKAQCLRIIKEITDYNKNNSLVVSKEAMAITTFLSFVHCKDTHSFCKKPFKQFIEDYKSTLLDMNNKSKYDEFINHSINTIDSYGVASALMVVLKSVHHLMDGEFVKELSTLLYRMYHPNQQLRLDINAALPLYENCLENFILKDQKMQFKENKIIKETKTEKEFTKKINSIKLKDVTIRSAKTLKTLTLSPKKLCPENREYNPITRRCNNKCKKGYIRNSLFKCIRKTLKNKDCPEGMVVNTKTNRCIKFKKRKTRRSAK